MENVIERYLNWKEIENFMTFLKKSANWLCLVNDGTGDNWCRR